MFATQPVCNATRAAHTLRSDQNPLDSLDITLLNSSQVRKPSLFLSILMKASSTLSGSLSGLTEPLPLQQQSNPPEPD